MKRITTLAWRWVLPLVLVLPLAACGKDPAPETYSANISPYNHTGEYIHQSYVDGAGGGNSYPYGGGGSFVCCISYPAKWHPGLSAKVRWTTSSGDPSDKSPDAGVPHWHEKVVPIDRYDKPGSRLNLHFLPNGEVRLVISNMGAGAKGYPGPDYPEKPPG
jgi:hypothetical protein